MPSELTPVAGIDARAYSIAPTNSLVTLERPDAPGYAFAWAAALRGVLARGLPFVLVDYAGGEPEAESDKQLRRCCIRAHGERLMALCRGVILIEGDVARRAYAKEEAQGIIGNLPIRIVVVSKAAVAEQLAAVLLTNDLNTAATSTRLAGSPAI